MSKQQYADVMEDITIKASAASMTPAVWELSSYRRRKPKTRPDA
jgi:hypothetical protein